MNVSEARIAANRENSKRSTGPRTPEGKSISRANALKHGLCASTVVVEDAKLVLGRAEDYFKTLKPQNDFHCWLVTEISLLTIKIDRAERMDRRARDKIAIKAELCWDDDQRLEAELLGEQLGNRPAVVVEQLRKTPQGCEWLMTRWALLAYSAETKGGWTPEQVRLAFDLLATPIDFREGNKPGIAIDFRGKVVDPGLDPAEVARREIEALEERAALVGELGQANQALAQADLYDDSDGELKRVRKHEGALHGRLRWCLRQLQEQAPAREIPRGLLRRWLGDREAAANPIAEPSTVAEIQPTSLPEPVAVEEPPPDYGPTPGQRFPVNNLPFDLEPHEFPEPGQSADLPKIIAGRLEKKLQKAEARRVARRRKVEDLRA